MNNNQKLEWLNKRVYGHTQAKKILINMLNRVEARHAQLMFSNSSDIDIPSTFLIGDSGTGKTFLVNTIAELYKYPVFHVDATTLGPAGASSKSMEKLTKEITNYCIKYSQDNNTEYPTASSVEAKLLIFIDEMDKLSISHDSSGNWHTMVQASLLTLMEGHAPVFVFAGAFSKNKSLRHDDNKKSIGFLTDDNQDIADDDLAEKAIKAGLIPELVGRVGHFCLLDKLNEDNYMSILNDLLIPDINKTFTSLNKPHITLTDEFREEICKKAYQGSTGVRYLKQRLSEYVIEWEFNSVITSGYDYKKELEENCDYLQIEFIKDK